MRKPKTSVVVRPQNNAKKGFNDNDAKYMCCRNKYHLRKAAVIVGGLELAAIGVTIVYCVIAYLMDGFYKTPPTGTDPIPRRRSLLILALVMSIIAGIIWSVAIGLMIWGIKKSRPALLIPHMMIQVLAIISLGGLTALFIWWAVDVNDNRKSERNGPRFGGWEQEFRADPQTVVAATAIFSILAIASFLGFVVEIFFFFLVRRCYKYLRAKINYLQQQQRKQSQAAKPR